MVIKVLMGLVILGIFLAFVWLLTRPTRPDKRLAAMREARQEGMALKEETRMKQAENKAIEEEVDRTFGKNS